MIKFAGFMGNRKGRAVYSFRILILISLLCTTVLRSLDPNGLAPILKKTHAQEKASFPIQLEIKSVSLDAVVPLLELNLAQDLFTIQLPFQLPLNVPFFIPESFRYKNKYFKTLFSFIISPNAP